jgi:hypothetical protein
LRREEALKKTDKSLGNKERRKEGGWEGREREREREERRKDIEERGVA